VAVEQVMNHVNSADPENSEDSVHRSSASLDPLQLLVESSEALPWHTAKSNDGSALSSVGESLKFWTCAGLDVWSNKHFVSLVTELTATVESHGTVFYEFRCSPSKMGLGLFTGLMALCFVSVIVQLGFVLALVLF
jgi:hypothetical protein